MSIAFVGTRNTLATAYGTANPYLTLLLGLKMSAAVAVGATSVTVDLSVAVGDTIVFDFGQSGVQESKVVTGISGSGPYTASFSATTIAHGGNLIASHLPALASGAHEVPGITRIAANWGAASASSITAAPASSFSVASGYNIGAVAPVSAVTGGTLGDADAVPGQNFASAGSYAPSFTYTQN